MKKILIDTNIILDIAFRREPFYETACKLLFQVEANTGELKAYISASSITDIYYIVSRKAGKKKALDFLQDILKIFDIACVDRDVIRKAMSSGLADFEDAVQVCCAESNGIRCIISRNKKDFTGSSTDVFSPEEFLVMD